MKGLADVAPALRRRNLHFGVREHGMGAVLNGMACTAACAPTAPRSRVQRHFRPSIRLAA